MEPDAVEMGTANEVETSAETAENEAGDVRIDRGCARRRM